MDKKKDSDKKENKAAQALKDKLFAKFPNVWDKRSEKERQEAFDFAVPYMAALDAGKTERLYVDYTIDLLLSEGFVTLDSKEKLSAGDRVYQAVRGRGLVAAVIGDEDPRAGFNLIGAHIDSPRLDLKPQPVYEDKDLVLFKTHYYGGIKKYQWAALPLAIKGVAYTGDGDQVVIDIGDHPDDPAFCVTDLLPHLGREQMSRKATEVIRGEDLNVLVGGLPYPDEETKERFKLGLLMLLYERYGITERDLVTAEIEVVPAGQARDVGFDRSFIGAYGQDDRVCAYTATRALLDVEDLGRTGVVILYDKEETGSDGNTGAGSALYAHIQHEILRRMLSREPTIAEMNRNFAHSVMISSDVTNAYDPTYSSVSDPLNSAYAGRGVAVAKYGGRGGKGGTSDASSELFYALTNCFDEADVYWQAGELGKVDMGGGGTVAKFQAALGMEVIDCGVPVLSMHSCFEVTSKIDVYETYRGYVAFLETMKPVEDQIMFEDDEGA